MIAVIEKKSSPTMQGVLNGLTGDGAIGADAQQLASTLQSLPSLHEQLGLPRLELKLPVYETFSCAKVQDHAAYTTSA